MQPQGGELLLHDNGVTVENLLCQGLNLGAERRQALMAHACAGCGVRQNDNRLEITASMANFPQRLHFLVSAILRVNDLWLTASPHAMTDFFALVAEFLDQQSVLYTANVSVPGRTVEHPMDFIIPLPRQAERLVRLVASPRPQTAKLISFTWLDIGESRPKAEKVVLVNDVLTADPLDVDGVHEDEARRGVSDQTLSILQAYSDRVFRWSEHGTPAFRALWAAAA